MTSAIDQIKTEWPLIYANASGLPEDFAERYPAAFRQRIGRSFSGVFEEFASAFPITAAVIDANWAAPVVVFKEFEDDLLTSMIAPRLDRHLQFGTNSIWPADYEPAELARKCAMLPPRWAELYHWMNSFWVTNALLLGRGGPGLPLPYSNRFGLLDYRQAPKAARTAFAQAIGTRQPLGINCWLKTLDNTLDGKPRGDMLFIDEVARDRRVYHVHRHEFADFAEVHDPEERLDRYMAHYLRGEDPEAFDWRG